MVSVCKLQTCRRSKIAVVRFHLLGGNFFFYFSKLILPSTSYEIRQQYHKSITLAWLCKFFWKFHTLKIPLFQQQNMSCCCLFVKCKYSGQRILIIIVFAKGFSVTIDYNKYSAEVYKKVGTKLQRKLQYMNVSTKRSL